jgi:hypothetical protein
MKEVYLKGFFLDDYMLTKYEMVPLYWLPQNMDNDEMEGDFFFLQDILSGSHPRGSLSKYQMFQEEFGDEKNSTIPFLNPEYPSDLKYSGIHFPKMAERVQPPKSHTRQQ